MGLQTCQFADCSILVMPNCWRKILVLLANNLLADQYHAYKSLKKPYWLQSPPTMPGAGAGVMDSDLAPLGAWFLRGMNRIFRSEGLTTVWRELPGRLPNCWGPGWWWFHPRLEIILLCFETSHIAIRHAHECSAAVLKHGEYVPQPFPMQYAWDSIRYQNDNATAHCARTVTGFRKQQGITKWIIQRFWLT